MARHKILVTGASGFIGARLVRQLVESGEQVKAMVRASSSLKFLQGMPADQLEIVEGDVTVGHTVYRSLAGCDRLFHVAALTKFWDRNKGAVEAAAVVGTTEVFEAARRRKLERVVFTSSVAALGRTYEREEMDETHEFNIPDADEYVGGKTKAEKIALEHQKDFEVVSVLPSSVFGPGDWKPTPGGKGILQYLTWNVPFFDFPAPAGGINIVDVDDVVAGHMAAMEKGKSGERYVLGGDNVTYQQMFTILSEITGLPGPSPDPLTSGVAEAVGRLLEARAFFTDQEPEVTFRSARDFVNKYSWVSSAKAERELGYRHRTARRALARSVQWYLENGYVEQKTARRIRVDLRAPALVAGWHPLYGCTRRAWTPTVRGARAPRRLAHRHPGS
jgi:dihydroflavonol-4-reductase